MPKTKYEVILAIVNEGLADDVMDVARECGVRGGTILTARGVTNEEAAAFFGISIHSEKEILMMVDAGEEKGAIEEEEKDCINSYCSYSRCGYGAYHCIELRWRSRHLFGYYHSYSERI